MTKGLDRSGKMDSFSKAVIRLNETLAQDLPTILVCKKSELKEVCASLGYSAEAANGDSAWIVDGQLYMHMDSSEARNSYEVGSMLAKNLNSILVDRMQCILTLSDEGRMQAIEAFILRNASFEEFKTKEKTRRTKDLNFIVDNKASCDKILAHTNILVENVFYTRRLCNMPGNLMRPSDIATEAYKLEDLKIKCKVLQADDIKEMECLTAVGNGSCDKPKLVVLEWIPKPDKPVIALVGKGITFDSGGLNIKPTNGMADMKFDKCGGITVMGIIRAVAQMKLDYNIVSMIPCAENMISGSCTRPGDIWKSSSGQTVEIDNTDAEGRLVLCEALEYVQTKYKPSIVIDFATLTGAIVVALGQEMTGAFCNDEDLWAILNRAGQDTWERLWRMPLDTTYNKLNDSNIADIVNSSKSRGAGAITAAHFLGRFIHPEVKWAHLDIAGTASTGDAPGTFHDKFSSGVCVRMFLQALPELAILAS